MKALIRNLTVACVALSIMGFLFYKTKAVDIQEHNRFLTLLLEMQHEDASLNENLLKARNANLINYDPIVKNVFDLKSGTSKLKDLPGFLDKESFTYQKLNDEVQQLLDMIKTKESYVERFKSENSILRNSLSFFPFAAFTLAEMNREKTSLSQGVQGLLRDILMYNLHSNEEILPRIQMRIGALSAMEGLIGRPRSDTDLQRVIDHSNAILTYKDTLDSLTADALTIPIQHKLRNIQSIYRNYYIQNVSVANNYRLILYIYAILLTAAIAYHFLRLQNTTLALNETNRTLEKRVEERTEDLNSANIKLTKQKDQLVTYLDELRSARDELHRLSITDELTGLYTRRFLFEWLEKQVEGLFRNTGQCSCLMLDVDFFKDINDSFGHGEGDKVLQQIADTINGAVRHADVVGRYGGEEFLVLFPNTSLANAKTVAENIRAAIEKNVKHPRQVTASMGIASLECKDINSMRPNISETISTLLGQADKALYQAKDNGRNRVESPAHPITL